MTMNIVPKHIGEGHRKRLRDRFLNNGLDGFLDYEIVELLLTLGTPRKDCKQPAKEAIKKFQGLAGVLDSSIEELQQVNGIGPSNAFGIKLFQAVSKIYAKEKITFKILLNSSQAIYEYLKERIGREKKEHFTILCLDTRYNLIVEDVSIGILNASLVHPREVFKKAILNNSAYVVIAHNHPSGDPNPSDDDIMTTRRLVESGKILGIIVIDHIIVTKNDFVSLKEKGIIK
jgi:DNA repair protein RadC